MRKRRKSTSAKTRRKISLSLKQKLALGGLAGASVAAVPYGMWASKKAAKNNDLIDKAYAVRDTLEQTKELGLSNPLEAAKAKKLEALYQRKYQGPGIKAQRENRLLGVGAGVVGAAGSVAGLGLAAKLLSTKKRKKDSKKRR